MSKPFILGQRVLYTVTTEEAGAITLRRDIEEVAVGRRGNHVHAGQQYPADVVAVFDSQHANLQVHLDGNDSLWTTSRQWGEGEGTCQETAF